MQNPWPARTAFRLNRRGFCLALTSMGFWRLFAAPAHAALNPRWTLSMRQKSRYVDVLPLGNLAPDSRSGFGGDIVWRSTSGRIDFLGMDGRVVLRAHWAKERGGYVEIAAS